MPPQKQPHVTSLSFPHTRSQIFDLGQCHLCTIINHGGQMHYLLLFGFKTRAAQSYFFTDNLLLCD